MKGSYGEILFIESVLSKTVCMWGQNCVPEKFVLKFCDLWRQFLAVRVHHLVLCINSESFFNNPSYIFIGLQNIVMYIRDFLKCVEEMSIWGI